MKVRMPTAPSLLVCVLTCQKSGEESEDVAQQADKARSIETAMANCAPCACGGVCVCLVCRVPHEAFGEVKVRMPRPPVCMLACERALCAEASRV